MALSPTPPAPITATRAPGRSRAVLTTAPTPVITPQASRRASSAGRSSGRPTSWLASTTTASAKAAVFIPCATAAPPASRSGDGAAAQAWAQEVGAPPAQAGQAPQARISVTRTRSPPAKPRTPAPTAVTRPAASWP